MPPPPQTHRPQRFWAEPSQTLEPLAELLQTRQVVAAREDVDVRERRAHSPRERLVRGIFHQGVQPDDAVREPRQPGHLLAQQLRVADVEAVRAADDERAAGEAGVAVLVQEALQRVADAGSAAP